VLVVEMTDGVSRSSSRWSSGAGSQSVEQRRQ
jgi:hypothetical protein